RTILAATLNYGCKCSTRRGFPARAGVERARAFERTAPRARPPRLHRHRAGALGRAPAPGLPDLRPRMAGAGSTRSARLFLSVADQIGSAALRLRARDARRPLDAPFGVHRRSGSDVVDHRPCDPVLPSLRAPAAAAPGDPRLQLPRPAGADEPRPALGAARRAP